MILQEGSAPVSGLGAGKCCAVTHMAQLSERHHATSILSILSDHQIISRLRDRLRLAPFFPRIGHCCVKNNTGSLRNESCSCCERVCQCQSNVDEKNGLVHLTERFSRGTQRRIRPK